MNIQQDSKVVCPCNANRNEHPMFGLYAPLILKKIGSAHSSLVVGGVFSRWWWWCVFFTLTSYFHPSTSTAQPVSVPMLPRETISSTTAVVTNYETDIKCNYSWVIWPCNANRIEHAVLPTGCAVDHKKTKRRVCYDDSPTSSRGGG